MPPGQSTGGGNLVRWSRVIPLAAALAWRWLVNLAPPALSLVSIDRGNHHHDNPLAGR